MSIDISKLDLTALEGLSDEEKQLALSVLKEYADKGESETFSKLLLEDYAEIPVDINTFINDDMYLGKGLCIVDEGTGKRKQTVFPYWIKVLNQLFPNNLETSHNTLILSGAIGLGKAQPLSSIVMTADGPKEMGRITLADKVYGNDGQLHNVLGIFPQGIKPVYKITFTDGTSCECSDQHLWTIYPKNQKKYARTVELKDLLDKPLYRTNQGKYKERLYYIPMTKPLAYKHINTFISPYIIGCLIGDGSLASGQVGFTSADEEIIARVRSNLQPGYILNKVKAPYAYHLVKDSHRSYKDLNGQLKQTPNEYAEQIKNYKLNVTSLYKHIPHDYLYNDIESRIALLQGLMDTDGTVTKNGSTIQFNTISSTLRDDFIQLVESLGGSAWYTGARSRYKKNGVYHTCNSCYTITLKLPKSIAPFSLSRKQNRLKAARLEPSRAIDKIEYLRDERCQCIYIDSPEHLYLTDHFIVTHNTLVAVVAMLYMLYRMLCLKDPYKHFGLQPIDHITFSIMNITIDAAKGVAWAKIQELLQSSPWFLQHGRLSKSINPEWQPNQNIELIYGSQPRHVIGRAVFCLAGDTEIITPEGVIKLEDAIDKEIKVYSYDANGKIVVSESCEVKPTIKTADYYEITLENGETIKCTGNHRFLLKDGTYKAAEDLTENDELADVQIV